MSEITWRTVTAPNQGSANQLGAQGLQTLLEGIGNLGKTLQKPLKEDERKQKEAFNQAIQLAGLDQGQQRIDNQNEQFGTGMEFKESEATRSQGNIENAAEAKVLAAKQGYEWDKLTMKQKNDWMVEAAQVSNQNNVSRDMVKMGFQTKEREASQEYTSEEKGKDRTFRAGESSKGRAAAKARNDASIAARPKELSPEAKAKAALETFEKKEQIKAKYAKSSGGDGSGIFKDLDSTTKALLTHGDYNAKEKLGLIKAMGIAKSKNIDPTAFFHQMTQQGENKTYGFIDTQLEDGGEGASMSLKIPNEDAITAAQKRAKEVRKNRLARVKPKKDL